MAMRIQGALAIISCLLLACQAQQNPCYCTTGNQPGSSACFNFDQASSDTNCAPPNANCVMSYAQPGQYSIQNGGPIYLCPAATTPTNLPVTPAPVTPAPVTPAPVTPAPVTPAPVTPTPTNGGTYYNPNYNPCYCSPPDSTGSYACFDFNGASSDVMCNPRGSCTLVSATPGSYSIQNGGPIYFCSS